MSVSVSEQRLSLHRFSLSANPSLVSSWRGSSAMEGLVSLPAAEQSSPGLPASSMEGVSAGPPPTGDGGTSARLSLLGAQSSELLSSPPVATEPSAASGRSPVEIPAGSRENSCIADKLTAGQEHLGSGGLWRMTSGMRTRPHDAMIRMIAPGGL